MTPLHFALFAVAFLLGCILTIVIYRQKLLTAIAATRNESSTTLATQQERLAMQQTQLNEKSAQLQQQRDDLARQQQQLQQLEQQASALRAAEAEKEHTLHLLRQQMEQQQHDLSQSRQQYAQSQAELAQRSASIATLEEQSAQWQRLQLEHQQLRQQYQELQQQNTEQQKRNAELVRGETAHQQQLDEQRSQYEQIKLELGTARQQLEQTHLELRQRSASIATLEEQAAQWQRLQAEYTQLRQQHDSLQQEQSTLQKRNAELIRGEQANQQQISEQRNQHEQLKLELDSTRQQLEKTHLELRQRSASIATLEEQAAQWQRLQLEHQQLRQQYDELQQHNTSQQKRNAELVRGETALQQQLEEIRAVAQHERGLRENAEASNSQLRSEHAQLHTQLKAEREQAGEKLALLQQAREQLGQQFQNLANQILEEKTQKFTEQNQNNLGQLLQPLQEKIREFQSKVEETYDKESKERFSLGKEIQRLVELNTRIGEDAVNLTNALKGSNKTQGTWGEIVLENVLDSAGLRKGEEYEVQLTLDNDDGNKQRPDVIVHLPDNKHLIIDAKMTLIAYERYTLAQTDAERSDALKQHLQSIRNHIKGLSEKNYQQLAGLNTPDFVMLFIPIEPAFMLAVTGDHSLFNEAFSKNVLLVSPSTLLATLRTVANIWRQEYQNRNAQAIAAAGGKLYDKLVGFVDDMQKIGQRLEQTQEVYAGAMNKLSRGNGNLLRQAENVRKMGITPSKKLPAALLDPENAEDEIETA